MQIEGFVVPSLRTVHAYPTLYPKFTADTGAIKFLLKGANVMSPGLTNEQSHMDDVKAGSIVAVYVHGHEHAIVHYFPLYRPSGLRRNPRRRSKLRRKALLSRPSIMLGMGSGVCCTRSDCPIECVLYCYTLLLYMLDNNSKANSKTRNLLPLLTEIATIIFSLIGLICLCILMFNVQTSSYTKIF